MTTEPENIDNLGYPSLPWLPDYVKYVLLDGGYSILPYMCDKDFVQKKRLERNE